MKSIVCAVSVMSLLVLAGVVSRSSGAAADDPVKIEKIMDSLHKGRKSPLATLKTALKSQSPDWSVVQKEAKTYVKYAVDLPKNDPPKGDAASWKKMATAFATNAKALEQRRREGRHCRIEGLLRQARHILQVLPRCAQGRLILDRRNRGRLLSSGRPRTPDGPVGDASAFFHGGHQGRAISLDCANGVPVQRKRDPGNVDRGPQI